MSKVVISDPCWKWIGTIDAAGYAIFHVNRQGRKAARISFALFHGSFDKDLIVCHRCDNRECVNPDHLFLGTPADNSADMVLKGRSAKGNKSPSRLYPEKIKRGVNHHNSKLSENDVMEILALSQGGIAKRELSRRYGVSRTSVKGILNGTLWNHITHLR